MVFLIFLTASNSAADFGPPSSQNVLCRLPVRTGRMLGQQRGARGRATHGTRPVNSRTRVNGLAALIEKTRGTRSLNSRTRVKELVMSRTHVKN